ncbi:hypothetical protein FNYG_13057 [Fusarium nygamai]|uniref:NACHT domain-containing protein n=1 Tax=Gibberella nygamai TaxID=42673 RepID=A0A2K0VU90_GIBNY|nr:hypothetical protein FNYG_13057 [Fusarium nygamai]
MPNLPNLPREYEVLHTKVDLEKTLLLRWAKGVNLLNPHGYDERLDDPATSKVVVRTLKCIKAILEDTSELQERYGLEVKETDKEEWEEDSGGSENATSIEDNRLPTISRRPRSEFIQKFRRLNLEASPRQETPPLRKRAWWMIRDKKKFEGFVSELAHFTAKINDVVPISQNPLSVRNMDEENTLKEFATIRQLGVLLAALGDRQQTLFPTAPEKMAEKCEDRILDLLWFRRITDRRDGIATAHTKSLHWALEPPTAEVPWDDLSHWLRAESGIYWVCGKAGSGKSTLMKYLYSHRRTYELLSEWAGGEPFLLCDFFYYNLGSIEQKSQEGLSRALLYQILSRHPSLISAVLPNMWKELLDTEKDAALPSEAEANRAFDTILRLSSSLGKVCFLIDGVDELACDYRKPIAFIEKLAACKSIKILVSSRPIPECVAAFGSQPNLRLQDLNRNDITLYVEDIIGSHSYMKKLTDSYPEKCAELMETLIDKSSGVFLWIILACRSLLGGFAAYDRVSELEARVDQIPPELEDLFQQMLKKIDRRYRKQGSRLLQICYVYTRQEEPEKDALSALGLALIEDYHLDMAPVRTLEANRKRDLCEELEGRLRSRCGGLLELSPANPRLRHSCVCGKPEEADHDSLVDAAVVFMHRTVFDFLNNEDVWDLEYLQVPDDRFSTTTALALYHLHVASQPNQHIQKSDTTLRFWQGLRQNLLYNDPKHDTSLFFANLQSLVDLPMNHGLGYTTLDRPAWGIQWQRTCPLCPSIPLLLAVEAEAIEHVAAHPQLKDAIGHSSSCRDCLPLLYHAFKKPLLSEIAAVLSSSLRLSIMESFSLKLMPLLLSLGCDPNERAYGMRFHAITTWEPWLEDLPRKDLGLPGVMHTFGIVEQFLQANALNADLDLANIQLGSRLMRSLNSRKSNNGLKEKVRHVLQLIYDSRRRLEGLSLLGSGYLANGQSDGRRGDQESDPEDDSSLSDTTEDDDLSEDYEDDDSTYPIRIKLEARVPNPGSVLGKRRLGLEEMSDTSAKRACN